MTAVLEVSNLNVTFPTRNGAIRASQEVNVTIRQGEIAVLVGETGSGKSVIGLAILHLLPDSANISGQIRYKGADILSLSDGEFSRLRGREISLIPQNPSGSLDPLMRCGDQIGESLAIGGTQPGVIRPGVLSILERLRFSDPDRIARSLPHALSGGMRQRVTTGIAIASGPRLLISDEPTKGLDYHSRKTTLRIFLSLKQEHRDTQLLITHDLDLARTIGDVVSVLYSGEIIESGPVSEVFENPHHPYTRGLIAALPRNGMKAMPGICPGLTSLPAGCYFHDRCPHPCTEGERVHPHITVLAGHREVRCHRFSK